MICAFHLPCKPRSANKQPKPAYTRMIGEAARESYTGPLVSAALYSRIIWFHKYASTEGDADNIAKRVHDALKGIIFQDDRLITHTLAIRVDASEQVEIVPDPAHPGSSARLAESLLDDSVRDILYIEVGVQALLNVHLGPIT